MKLSSVLDPVRGILAVVVMVDAYGGWMLAIALDSTAPGIVYVNDRANHRRSIR